MSRAGRELELVIKRLEESSLPEGAKISSPGFLTDKITSQSREVDILIEHQIGTVAVKIAIECRDRKSIQDTTWIEQLISKFRDIQVDRMIVVSSGKYTKPAIKKADSYNIELRRLEEIDSELVKCWWNVEYISLLHTKIQIQSVRIKLNAGYDNLPPIEPDINQEIIHSTHEHKSYSLNTLITNAINGVSVGWRMIHGANKPFIKEVQLSLENEEQPETEYFLQHNENKYFTKQIDFLVEITFVEKKEFIAKSSVYKNHNQDLSYLLEYNNFLPEMNSKLEIIKNAIGEVRLVIRKEE